MSATRNVNVTEDEDENLQAFPHHELNISIEEGHYEADHAGFLCPHSSSTSGFSTIAPKNKKDKSIPETLSKAIESFSTLVNAKMQNTSASASSVENSGDFSFMKSVVSDISQIPVCKKIKFKREVMELLEKYISETEQ